MKDPSAYSSPAAIVVRSAEPKEEREIRAMVARLHLNPMSIHWPNFRVALAPDGRIVGIGQVKRHGDGSRELASIGVDPDWRKRGVAAAVIRSLLSREAGVLYLTCRGGMVPFYVPFGFRRVGLDGMTPYFRRLYRLVSCLVRIHGADGGMAVMRRDPASAD